MDSNPNPNRRWPIPPITTLLGVLAGLAGLFVLVSPNFGLQDAQLAALWVAGTLTFFGLIAAALRI
jgi:hypothetical protein